MKKPDGQGSFGARARLLGLGVSAGRVPGGK